MKRLVLILFFALYASVSFALDSKDPDVRDCSVLLIFADLWNSTPLNQVEGAAWIVRTTDGSFQPVHWQYNPDRRAQHWSGNLPENLAAQVHTHPDRVDPKPSAEDKLVAQKMSIPLYTVSRNGVWKASPNGEITQEKGSGWFKDAAKSCGKLADKR
ncbi:MAG: hypothetical protein C5B54_12390 [Acidobacteria bacterium]|nr:MAG: hypothetical protein C5B54_12390 [Acidobacteriota bacterium]